MSFLDVLILRRWDIQQTDWKRRRNISQRWRSGGLRTHLVVKYESPRRQRCPLELCSAAVHIISA